MFWKSKNACRFGLGLGVGVKGDRKYSIKPLRLWNDPIKRGTWACQGTFRTSVSAVAQIFSQANTSVKRWLLNFAAKRKGLEVSRGVIRCDSVWDKIFFHKIQVRAAAAVTREALAALMSDRSCDLLTGQSGRQVTDDHHRSGSRVPDRPGLPESGARLSGEIPGRRGSRCFALAFFWRGRRSVCRCTRRTVRRSAPPDAPSPPLETGRPVRLQTHPNHSSSWTPSHNLSHLPFLYLSKLIWVFFLFSLSKSK